MPEMRRVRQLFSKSRIDDVALATRLKFQEIAKGGLAGRSVAITAGSRGIANIALVTKTVADVLKEKGARPFIVPAMGSHGGGTAEGQRLILEHYGITEGIVGVPVKSSMEAVRIGDVGGIHIYTDKLAFEADHIVVINRIKAHSDFKADYESGLCKMLVIGLGKHLGANAAHRAGSSTFGALLPQAAQIFVDTGKILGAVAIVENAGEETAIVEALPPDEIIGRERELLALAKEMQGRLLLEDIDILILDEIGKNISGAGMDPNVTGRPPTGAPGFDAPPIGRIIVRGLTECSDGNAIGIGMADIITLKMAQSIDQAPTYINALAAGVPRSAMLPMIANNDLDALAFAMIGLGHESLDGMKIVHAKNTLELEEIEVSSACLECLGRHKDRFEIMPGRRRMSFDGEGNLMAGIL
jgi:hypothetical protein